MRSSLFIVAGEASGDLHGAKLVTAMRRLDPEVTFWGIGGPKMKEQGVEILYHASDLGVVGLTEVWKGLKSIRRALHGSRQEITRRRPDAILLLDFPDFNLRLAKNISELGIPILYYISPQLWAWRAGRMKTIKKLVQKMFVVFPFEEEMYRKAGVSASFVGHPLLEEIDRETADIDVPGIKKSWGISSETRVVALMPGSRRSELGHHLKLFLETARVLWERHRELRFVLPVAPTLPRSLFEEAVRAARVPVELTQMNATRVMAASDVVLVASGTSTLQAGLLGKPMVVVYRVAAPSYWLLKRLVRGVSYVALPNIILGKRVVPELLQDQFHPFAAAHELERFLVHHELAEETQRELQHLRQHLAVEGLSASERVAFETYALCSARRKETTWPASPSLV